MRDRAAETLWIALKADSNPRASSSGNFMRWLYLLILCSLAGCSDGLRTASTPVNPNDRAAYCAEQARQAEVSYSAKDQFDAFFAGTQAHRDCLSARP